MRYLSLIAKVFIAGVIAIGAAALVHGLVHWTSRKPVELLAILVMTLIASRLKVKLPRINGTMSVNVPFLLIAAVLLSSGESLMIAALASLVQSIPSANRRIAPLKTAFSSATITNAVAAATLAFSFASHRRLAPPLSIVAAGTAFFLINTVFMALVLWLAEEKPMLETWRGMARLSVPYYVLSTGVAAVVCAVTQFALWGLALALLPLMYSIYTSYRLYFSSPAASETQPAEVKPIGRANIGVPSPTAAIIS